MSRMLRPMFGYDEHFMREVGEALDEAGVRPGDQFIIARPERLSDPTREPVGHARRTDPPTSHAAAKFPRRGQKQRILLALLRAEPAGLTASELAEATGIAYVTTSTKLTPLRREGWVRVEGTRETDLGAQANVCRLTDTALEELQLRAA